MSPPSARLRAPFALAALLALVALSGCSAAGSLSMDPVEDDADLAEHALRDLPPPGAADDPGDRRVRAIVDGAVENGSYTVRNAEDPPLPTDRPVAHEGAVYELNRTVVAERTVPQVDVRVDYNASESALDGPAVRYGDLPAPDRAALSDLLERPVDPDRLQEGPEIGRVADYEDPGASELVGGETVVVHEGERYLVTAERAGTGTVYDYRYEARRVAPDLASYGARLREEYAFTLSGLDDSERSVLREAADGSYYAESDDDAAFRSVLERFRAHEPVYGDSSSGEWVVRWNGQLYYADLDYGGFVDVER